MVIRVKMAPDSDGIIRIKCGDTDFEIEVEGNQPTTGGAGSPTSPGDVPINPGDIPGIYLNVPKKADGKIDIDQLLRDFEDQISDPSKPDPQMVLFQARQADLHEVSRLKRQIEKSMRDIPLAIDFGDLGRLKK